MRSVERAACFWLIEEILAPLLVGASDHAHDMTAGVQAEGARLPHQTHVDFAQQVVAFAVIAGMAARYKIFPG